MVGAAELTCAATVGAEAGVGVVFAVVTGGCAAVGVAGIVEEVVVCGGVGVLVGALLGVFD